MHLATMTIGYKRSFESVPCMRCRAGSAGDVLEDRELEEASSENFALSGGLEGLEILRRARVRLDHPAEASLDVTTSLHRPRWGIVTQLLLQFHDIQVADDGFALVDGDVGHGIAPRSAEMDFPAQAATPAPAPS